MSLSFPIGRNSNGEIYAIDLETQSHIFISYSETFQLDDFLRSLSRIGGPGHPISWYLAVDSSRSILLEDQAERSFKIESFYRDDPMQGTMPTRAIFIKGLHTELILRKKKKTSDAKCIIVVIDDIWNLIIHHDKQTGKRLLMLLTEGHVQGIHFVVASPTSYRNLLLQLIDNKKSSNKINLDKKLLSEGITTIGTEIIFTTDNLVFYQESGCREIKRFYQI